AVTDDGQVVADGRGGDAQRRGGDVGDGPGQLGQHEVTFGPRRQRGDRGDLAVREGRGAGLARRTGLDGAGRGRVVGEAAGRGGRADRDLGQVRVVGGRRGRGAAAGRLDLKQGGRVRAGADADAGPVVL